MGFLRRLLGRPADDTEPGVPPASPEELDAEERARERELLREDRERLDELRQRQLRYEEYAWTPPAQGGERRAEDEDPEGGPGL